MTDMSSGTQERYKKNAIASSQFRRVKCRMSQFAVGEWTYREQSAAKDEARDHVTIPGLRDGRISKLRKQDQFFYLFGRDIFWRTQVQFECRAWEYVTVGITAYRIIHNIFPGLTSSSRTNSQKKKTGKVSKQKGARRQTPATQDRVKITANVQNAAIKTTKKMSLQ